MGTTAVAAYVRGNQAFVAHVGDSRLYHVRDGALLWRTTDHTRVQKMVQMGILSAADAKDHPDANVVSRALGFANLADGTALEPEVQPEAIDLRPGDSLILCTDGLFDGVTDPEIAGSAAGRTAADCARWLVDLANERGGHDNITVTVLHYGKETGAKPGPASSKSLAPGSRRVTSVDEGGGGGGGGKEPGSGPGKAKAAGAAASEPAAANKPAESNRKALVLILLGVGLLLAGTALFWYTRHKKQHGGAPPVPVPDASVGGGSGTGVVPDTYDAEVELEPDAGDVPAPGEVPGIVPNTPHTHRTKIDGGVVSAGGRLDGGAGTGGHTGKADGGVRPRGTSPLTVPSGSPTPSPSPSGTPKPSPTPSGTAKPSPSPSGAPKPSPTPAVTPKPSPTAVTPKPSPSPSGKPKVSPSPSPSPSGKAKTKPATPDDGTVN
jgi:Protein phosphatase 2C